MKNIDQLIRLRKAHQLIKNSNTGVPKEFASKMNLSIRSLYRLLDLLKEMEAPICYDKKNFTYYYCSSFEFRFQIHVEVLKHEELIKIHAGNSTLQKFQILPCAGSTPNYL
jgi:predicted DNA-binding transcriptional regulator YafY